ncbi:MAG TPA: low molecular weight protein-tyrosine-phosphatase [Pseudoxanthomonas sp.]|jgi:protein-tyrosine phosphatase|nr:low molecular weight protein-tyrosine-phosphatase [Pseudoxanthomonas sp.]
MKLLLVCLGNICRSPMAEGAVRHAFEQAGWGDRVEVDSAGTGNWHCGEPPDARAIACARHYGVDISGLRARQLSAQDFHDFDWLLCADAQNLRDAQRIAPDGLEHKAVLLLDWAGIQAHGVVPDPYTGSAEDFHDVWRLVDSAASAAVRRLFSS